MSVIWVMLDGSETGAVVALRNHTTGDRTVINAQRIRSLFERPLLWKAGIALVVFFIGTIILDIIWGVVLALVVSGYLGWKALQSGRKLLASDALRSLDSELVQTHNAVARAS